MDQADTKASPKLRAAFFFGAAVGGISGRGKRVARARGALTIGAGLFVLALLLEGFRRYSQMMAG